MIAPIAKVILARADINLRRLSVDCCVSLIEASFWENGQRLQRALVQCLRLLTTTKAECVRRLGGPERYHTDEDSLFRAYDLNVGSQTERDYLEPFALDMLLLELQLTGAQMLG